MSRVVLVVLVLAALVFAGCTSAPESETTTETEPILHTSPLDRGNASEEDRRRSHLHDYWGGVTEFVVFDETARIGCTACGTGAPFFRFEPPGGAVFPQGTRWVNVTIAWETDATSAYRDPVLWVETAQDFAPWEVGPIENGDTVAIEVNETASDLPHELLSNWAFEVRVEADLPGGLWRGDGRAAISATAARGHPIEVFPPHPELWDEMTEIVLFEERSAAEPVYRGGPEGGQTGNSWMDPHMPGEGIVVPYDAALVIVDIDYDDDAPIPFTLGFHGADTREWTLLEPTETEEGTAHYEILLDDGLPDGPYARQSHWVFEVWADDEDHPFFMGGYSIRGVVYKEVP